jgi:exopolysaccharide biosynthesis polyprenyl glycosylphosphotransferase
MTPFNQSARAPEAEFSGVDAAGRRTQTQGHSEAKSSDSGSEPNPHSFDIHDRSRSSFKFKGRRVQLAYLVVDVCCIVVSSAIAFALRFPPSNFRQLLTPSQLIGMDHRYAGFLLLDIGLILLFCQGQQLYRTPLTRPFWTESVGIAKAISCATLLLTAFLYLSGVRIVSRAVVMISALIDIGAFVAWRYAKRRGIIRRIETGQDARNALIVGAGKVGQALAQLLQEDKLLRYRFIGFLDESHAKGSLVLGRVDEIDRIARRHFVDEVFITVPSERNLVKQLVLAARRQRFAINVIPDLYDGLGWNAPLRRIGRFPMMDLNWTPIPSTGLAAKRAIDVAFATLALILVTPLLVLLAIFIRFDSKGPIFYRSERVGMKGRVFSCHKLRTMVRNADALKHSLRGRNERQGPFFKISNDPRVTRVGRILRKYSLDELPQLWNVLVGEMSLVGPRPHPVDDYKLYALDDLRRLDVKPGMTGLWQVTARRDPSFQTSLRLDLDYIENWNLRTDLKILLRTFSAVLHAEGC